MTTQAVESSVTTSITANAPIERAFAVFTEEMGTWWPRVVFGWDITPEFTIETDLG